MFLLRQSTHRMTIRHDARLGHRFVPRLRARIPHEGGGYFVRTNAQGFRSDVDFEPARGDRPRILFFGDSFTAGDGCDNHERFAEGVGELLGAEVYNYGLSGSGTDQHLLAYEELAAEVEADLVVVCVYVENVERIKVRYRESIDRVSGDRVLVPKPYFELEGDRPVLHHVPVPLERPRPGEVPRRHYQGTGPRHLSGLYRMVERARGVPRLGPLADGALALVRRMRRAGEQVAGADPYPDYRSPDSAGWRLMEAILRRFAERVAPTSLLIVPLPTRHDLGAPDEPAFPERFASLEDRARGAHVADLTNPLRALSAEEQRRLAFRRDPHLSAHGHRVVARHIADGIQARDLLSPRPAPRAPASAPAPRRPTWLLGISAFYHDSAAALVRDGEIVAAVQEERFTRQKNDRRFPQHAVNYCLEEGGIHARDLDAVVYYDNASRTFERILHTQLSLGEAGEEGFGRVMPSWVQHKLRLPELIRRYLDYEGPVLWNDHHRSHVGSAFYPSPFERAAVLTIDGVGEWATAAIGRGEGASIELLREMHFPHSVGLLYSAFTQFTGFKVNSGEYKMMGLAPYGRPRYVDAIREHVVDVKEDGSIELHLDRFAFMKDPTMTNARFAELFGGPARDPDAPITRREMDIARSIQDVTEEIVLKMARHAHALTGEKRLCMSGGVALNCVANGRLLREGPFEELWIQPAAGDAGSALGAALDAWHDYFEGPRRLHEDGRPLQGGSYLGPDFSDDEIRGFLETHGYPYRELADDARASDVAEALEAGRVVGHLSGRSEFGPRALGARSILGDARNQDMQVNLNLKIKYRESFRPFAPSILAERASEYFDLEGESPYMLLVAPVREERRLPFELGDGEDLLPIVREPRSDVPAITHVDYSARVQTVRREDHPAYYDLIRAFAERTGTPTVVNTSFNVRGEPIVCTPYDAYRCFMRTEMDVLVLGRFLLEKRDQPPWPELKGHVEEHAAPQPAAAGTPLQRDLRALFRRQVAPLAARAREQGALRIPEASERLPSRWVPVEGRGPEDVFRIPAALEGGDRSDREVARAVVASWGDVPLREDWVDLLAALLEIGQKHPGPDLLEEEVSESVYVMF